MARVEARESRNIQMRHGKTLHSKPVGDWLWRTYIADIWQVKLSWVAHCHLRTHDATTISSALAGANVKDITSDDRSHTDSLLFIIEEKESNAGDDRNANVESIVVFVTTAIATATTKDGRGTKIDWDGCSMPTERRRTWTNSNNSTQ